MKLRIVWMMVAVAVVGWAGPVIQADKAIGAPAAYGLERLQRAFDATRTGADVTVLAGLCGGDVVASALRGSKGLSVRGPESLAIRRTKLAGKPALILCGSDSRGLMYAALDVAERVRWAGAGSDPLIHVRDTDESPFLAERGVSMYTMQRAYFESRLYDENHWKRYFDLLAGSRINSFTVIFGYENGGFLAPAYPYFFNVAGFPQVRMVGLTGEQQTKNLNAFRTMIRIAHERGIEVTAGIWDHIYRGGVQGGGIPGASDLAGKEVPGLVTGVTAENLAEYTKAALGRLMEAAPEIDGLEFRMHNESGLKREEMGSFWHEVFTMLRRVKPGMKVTLRAKELPDVIIEDALEQGLQARIETKYWMEQMGLPYHPTHINRQNQSERRHGYADLLKYPQKYRVHWRLWSGGTTRLLLWGDPEYVRRYVASARLYDGNSFDVNEMLATKMLAEPHDRAPLPILNTKYRHYDYEFERYWHFYQLWGRLSYNPATPAEVWEKEFERRFGAAGKDLMNGLHRASRVLPRIVAAAYRYQLFPTTRGWAEMMSQGDLAQFATLEGTDIEQFMSPRDAARSKLAGSDTSMRRPEETSRWFASTADRILESVTRAEASRAKPGAEATTTVTDLKILAWLARYYAARLPASVSYNVYVETKKPEALREAVEQERKAVEAWEQIVRSAGDVYAEDLPFGVHSLGFSKHWREELPKLRAGLERLTREAGTGEAAGSGRASKSDQDPPVVRLTAAGKAKPGEDLVVTAQAQDRSGIKSMRLRYRHLTQVEDYLSVEMIKDAKTGAFVARIPGGFIDPKWDLMYFVEAIDTAGNGRNYPDLEKEAPYVVVAVER